MYFGAYHWKKTFGGKSGWETKLSNEIEYFTALVRYFRARTHEEKSAYFHQVLMDYGQ